MDINDVHELINFLCNQQKKGQNTPEEKDKAIHMGQMDYFNHLRPKREESREVLGQSTYVHEALNPFRKIYDFGNTQSTGGSISIPDSAHILAVQTQISGGSTTLYSPVQLVNDDEIGYRMGSQIVQPTERYPVCIHQGTTGLQFFPQTPKAGRVFYLKTPEAPVWGYIERGRQLAYNEARSTQLDWKDAYIPQVITRAMVYLGINLDAESIYQTMQQQKAEVR